MIFSVTRTLPYDPAAEPSFVRSRLADSLYAAKAKEVFLTPYTVHFRSGFHFDRRNVLNPFDRGELTIDPVAHTVRLRVSFATLGIVTSSVLVILGIAAWVKLGPSPVIPEFLALAWLWLVLGNALYGASRLTRYLRNVIWESGQTR